jgi:hypothetical protein
VDVSEIKDEESLRAWLETLPARIGEDEARRWAVLIAHRAAMRVLPVFWEWSFLVPNRENLAVLIRYLYLGLVGSVYNAKEEQSLAFIANSINEIWPPFAKTIFSGDPSVVNPTASLGSAMSAISELSELLCFSYSAFAVTSSSSDRIPDSFNTEMAITYAKGDCHFLVKNEDLRLKPLWGNVNPFAEVWRKTRSLALGQGRGWDFWVNWYDKSLLGEPMDWKLLSVVAQMLFQEAQKHGTNWTRNVDDVNEFTARIVEQHRLAGEARSLKAEIEVLRSELELLKHRGHNSPPELVDETDTALCQTTIIWAALDEAETELEKPEPDGSVLAALAQRLFAAVKAVGLYCAKLGDTALQSAAKWAGGAGATYGGYLASQNERLQDFAEEVLRFVTSLGG